MELLIKQILSTIASGFRLMTPIALATLGITLSETSGVINLAAEGVMLASALCFCGEALRQTLIQR